MLICFSSLFNVNFLSLTDQAMKNIPTEFPGPKMNKFESV